MTLKNESMLSGTLRLNSWLILTVFVSFLTTSTRTNASELEEIQILNRSEVQKAATCYCNRIVSMRSLYHFMVSDPFTEYKCSSAGHIWKQAFAAAMPEPLPKLENVPIVISEFQHQFDAIRSSSLSSSVGAVAGSKGFKRILILSHRWSQANDKVIATIMEQQYRHGNSAQYIVFNSLGNQAAVKNMLHVAELENIDLIVALGRALFVQVAAIYRESDITVRIAGMDKLRIDDAKRDSAHHGSHDKDCSHPLAF